MERASLRPVPLRPRGPVEPAAALAHVEAALPDLDDAARQAFALVELVGRTRPELRAEAGVSTADLAAALARARKALRRAAFPLPGSGWCERAERLLSDELDGELGEPGTRRLKVHLANCERCVEHERQLRQARDRLVASFDAARATAVPVAESRPQPGEEPDGEAPERPDLQPDPEAAAPDGSGPEDAESRQLEPPAAPAAVEAPAPELRLVEPPLAEVETPTADDADTAETPVPGTPEPADPEPVQPVPGDPEPADPVPAEPAAAAPSSRISLAGAAWTVLLALAVLLALVSLALTGYALAGGAI